MRRRRDSFITAPMLVLALAAVFVGAAAGSVQSAPAADAGVLDLRSWSFTRDGAVPLTGRWELYWSRLVDPAVLAASQEPPPDLVYVPGSWNDLAAAHGEPGGVGYATYRLRVRLPDEPAGEELALHMPWVFTSYRLWVNGRLVAANGTIGTDPEDATPQFLPLTVPIGVLSDTADIVIHVSNFSHRNGGLWNTPLLGVHSQLARTDVVRQTLTAAVSGAVFLMALYHLVMYFVVRRWPEWLYLGLTAFATAVRTLVTGDHILGRMVGGLPWGVELRTEYLTGYIFMMAFMGLLHSLFPRNVSSVIVRGSQAYGALGVLTTLAAPVRLSSLVIPLSVWVSLALIAYCIAVLLIAWRRRRDGAGPMVAGSVVLLCLSCSRHAPLEPHRPQHQSASGGHDGSAVVSVAELGAALLRGAEARDGAGRRKRGAAADGADPASRGQTVSPAHRPARSGRAPQNRRAPSRQHAKSPPAGVAPAGRRQGDVPG